MSRAKTIMALGAAKVKLNELVSYVDSYGELDEDKIRNLAWETKRLLDKVKP